MPTGTQQQHLTSKQHGKHKNSETTEAQERDGAGDTLMGRWGALVGRIDPSEAARHPLSFRTSLGVAILPVNWRLIES